jgi:prephenate dehydratase
MTNEERLEELRKQLMQYVFMVDIEEQDRDRLRQFNELLDEYRAVASKMGRTPFTVDITTMAYSPSILPDRFVKF